MSHIEMTVYDSVYDLTSVVDWADEEEYRKAEEFLIGIGASQIPPKDAVNKAADFYLANEAQIEAFGRYKNSVVVARPRTGPPRLDMNYYVDPAGVDGKVTWSNEDEYQRARKFLIDIGVPPMPGVVPRYANAEFFYFETNEQWQAFRELRKSIEEGRGT
jgi:hypothetical protein